MNFHLSQAIGSIKVAMLETAQQSLHRRLTIHKDEITCKPKCAGCCRRLIYISVAEAIIISDYLVRTGKWEKIREKSRAQIEILKNSNSTSWFRMNISCPILENELCQAYSIRPPECSTHFVKSDPELCHPWSVQSGNYEKFDMVDLFQKFSEYIEKKTDSYGILKINLPIPVALLLANRIQVQSNKDTFETMRILFNELQY